jgi:guanine deaminase
VTAAEQTGGALALLPGYRTWRADVLLGDSLASLHIALDQLIIVDAQGIVAGVLPAKQWPGQVDHDFSGCLIAPGFIDAHLHFPQLDVIASPADGLLDWLRRHTFPAEQRFADPQHARVVAELFIDELIRHGITCAAVFATVHEVAVDALMQAALGRNLALIAGRVLQDRHSPPKLQDDTERSLYETETLIQRWHGQGRLNYAITPRFAPTSTERQLAGAAELAKAHPSVWVQSHVAENQDEIAWVAQLFPQARSYLDVYHQFGLVRPRSVWAHGIYLDDTDRALISDCRASIAVCPSSNLFLGSGLFDFRAAAASTHAWALASDIGGGTSFSPFRSMTAAFEVARLRGHTLSPRELWWHHGTGAARALGLPETRGRIAIGCEADLVVIDPTATELLARRWAHAHNDDERLFCVALLADDRHIRQTTVAGAIWKSGSAVLAAS